MTWRPWTDHPWIVGITVVTMVVSCLASVIGLYRSTVADKPGEALTYESNKKDPQNSVQPQSSLDPSQDGSPQVVLHAELKETCQANSKSAPCIFIGSTVISACKVAASSEYLPNAEPIPVCAQEVQNLLSAKGVSSQVFTQQLYDEGFNPAAPYNAGCIGWRSDLGGTREGALDIQQILGKGYTVGTGCNPSGYSYQVMLKT